MTAILQRLYLALMLAAGLAATTSAQADQTKHIYLKVGEGGGASAYAFKSKPACEAARREHDAEWARMINRLKKNIGNRGTFAAAPRARCLNSLPLGFVRPKVKI